MLTLPSFTILRHIFFFYRDFFRFLLEFRPKNILQIVVIAIMLTVMITVIHSHNLDLGFFTVVSKNFLSPGNMSKSLQHLLNRAGAFFSFFPCPTPSLFL